MKWITRKYVMPERTACPWLIKKYIDPNPEFIFVDWDKVNENAEKENAIPFDVSGVELGHHDGKRTMDAFIKKYDLKDPFLLELSKIFHGTPETKGVWAIIRGLSFGSKDDYDAIEKGYLVWESYYTHIKEKHLEEIYKDQLEKMGKNWQKRMEFLRKKLRE